MLFAGSGWGAADAHDSSVDCDDESEALGRMAMDAYRALLLLSRVGFSRGGRRTDVASVKELGVSDILNESRCAARQMR